MQQEDAPLQRFQPLGRYGKQQGSEQSRSDRSLVGWRNHVGNQHRQGPDLCLRHGTNSIPDNMVYTALVDHTVAATTVTATPNDSGAAVDIFSDIRSTTRDTANRVL